MEVRSLRWVGVRTQHHEAMVSFLRDVLGLRVSFEEPTTVELSTSEGDQVQVVAPGEPYFEFFGRHATGPVPLFEVDDVHAAREGAGDGRRRARRTARPGRQLGVGPLPCPGRQPLRAGQPPAGLTALSRRDAG